MESHQSEMTQTYRILIYKMYSDTLPTSVTVLYICFFSLIFSTRWKGFTSREKCAYLSLLHSYCFVSDRGVYYRNLFVCVLWLLFVRFFFSMSVKK